MGPTVQIPSVQIDQTTQGNPHGMEEKLFKGWPHSFAAPWAELLGNTTSYSPLVRLANSGLNGRSMHHESMGLKQHPRKMIREMKR